MFNREKLRSRLERETAHDHTRMRNWARRREERIERGMDSPMLPRLSHLCLIGMTAGAALAASGDLLASLKRAGGVSAFALKNAAASALFLALPFAAALILCCALQLRRGFDHPWYGAHALTRRGRARMPWRRKYRLWGLSAIAEILLLTALYALTRDIA